MNSTTPQQTPETDDNLSYGGTLVTADFARKLERERDEARAIVSACMSAMPVGNIQTHTPENLAARIGDLASALAAETSENEAMREAIKDAHYALAYVYNHGEGSCAFPFRTEDDLCSENRFHHAKDALDALKPFLP